MHDAVRAGPVEKDHPDVVLPLAAGFRAELWAGEPRFALPFLQPHFRDSNGRTVFDFRATTWSAAVRPDPQQPVVTLILSSGERKSKNITVRYPLELDLVTHRVTCTQLKGSTTSGMLQTMVRRVSGVKWLLEEIPQWFAKGRSLPD